jgi:hypothetical protein
MNIRELLKSVKYEVLPVTRLECEPFIIGIHYAKRWPSISYAFGLFKDGNLSGIVTYGTPPSAPLRRGIAGDDHIGDVIELNRLCLRDNITNEASMLIGRSLRLLPKGKIVISFADKSHGHTGCVYRASNFTYHGLSAKRTDWAVKGKEHLHGQTIADEFRGVKDRAQAMRDKYGDDFYIKQRPRKHRYIYITGSSKDKMRIGCKIKYKQQIFTYDNCDF